MKDNNETVEQVHKREIAELRECLKMAIVDMRIANTCFAFGRECDTCNKVCDAHKWHKTLKGANGEASEIELVKCETIPDEPEFGKLYYSDKYGTATHLCACGCGNKVVTPCKIGFWSIDTKDGKPTLSPSIGSFQLPCNSHYFINQGKVVWL